MKILLIGLAATSLISGAPALAFAQDTTVTHKESADGGSKTVIHKEDADGDRSKTIVKRENGSKTVIKRHGDRVKKIHTSPDGDKTVVKKSTE